jgi:hypothetical protein
MNDISKIIAGKKGQEELLNELQRFSGSQTVVLLTGLEN